ncbi:MAG: hypothetical protein J6Z49_04870 [Kiritimatiellae bacterium]|nr:hypothetical protein [Kiritimatiellia bacterium]
MKIKVVGRRWFEVKKREALSALFAENRIVSIQSSFGWDRRPPFPPGLLPHPNVRCYRFDDYTSLEEGCENREALPILFERWHAEAIIQFVADDSLPLIVQCTEGISRSAAVGQAFDWQFNCRMNQNPADHQFFLESNPQLHPNPLVLKVMMGVLGDRLPSVVSKKGSE